MTRNSGVATKQAVTAPRSKHAASHRESDGSRFGPAGQVLDLPGVRQHALEPLGLQPVKRPLPVVPGGLHHHRGHLPAPQPVRQRQHLPLSRAEAAGLGARRAGSLSEGTRIVATMPALPISMPHTRSRYSGSSVTSSTRPSPVLSLWTANLPGGTARGTGGERKKLTRVLEATMNGPLRSRFPASG